jgi:hypothetical protein
MCFLLLGLILHCIILFEGWRDLALNSGGGQYVIWAEAAKFNRPVGKYLHLSTQGLEPTKFQRFEKKRRRATGFANLSPLLPRHTESSWI